MSDENLRDLAEVDRIIHEPARLMISTILYASRKLIFSSCSMRVDLRRETSLPT